MDETTIEPQKPYGEHHTICPECFGVVASERIDGLVEWHCLADERHKGQYRIDRDA